MCDFFSFVQTKNGDIHYFNAKERAEIYNNDQVTIDGAVVKNISHPDSHDSIIRAFLDRSGRGTRIYDGVNKYEITVDTVNGSPALVTDFIVHSDIVARATQWMNKFCKSDEFLKICKCEIKNVAGAEDAAAFIFKHPKSTPEDMDNVIGYDINVLKYSDNMKLSPKIQARLMINWDELSTFGVAKVSPLLTSKRAAESAFKQAKGNKLLHIPKELMTSKIVRYLEDDPDLAFSHIHLVPKEMLTQKLKDIIIEGHYNKNGDWRSQSSFIK